MVFPSGVLLPAKDPAFAVLIYARCRNKCTLYCVASHELPFRGNLDNGHCTDHSRFRSTASFEE